MSEKKVYVFSSRWGSYSRTSYWEHCVKNNVVFINNEHDSVTNFPEIAKGVKKGDIIALRDGETMYAVGIASNDAEVKNVLTGIPLFNNNDEINKYGIDSEVNAVYVTVYDWYELTSKDKNVFNLKGLQDRVILIKENTYNNTREHIMEIYTSQLEGNMNDNEFKNNIERLLKNNYNLILTGAPGTGKTYLAKQIAAKMIFGEDKNLKDLNEDEKAKFKEQYKFVQFHPSYDYTDFVEGIRPVTKENNNYGFKRKDGIFKKFCNKAVENIKEFEKSYSDVDNNNIILKYLKSFYRIIDKTIQDRGKYDIYSCKQDKNIQIQKFEITDNCIIFTMIEDVNTIKLFNNDIVKMYLFYSDKIIKNILYRVNDFGNFVSYSTNHQTYYCAFVKEFYNKYHEQIENEINKNGSMKQVEYKPFVFVIDEINRGDINKILGELFYAIDLGYRGEKGKVETQYQNLVESGDVFEHGFYIPENVYIIGTMNDIDRSVESMDFAIRRRFAWQEVKPEDTADEILKDLEIDKNVANLNQKAVEILKKINNCIAGKDKEESTNNILGEMYQIGASYFLKLDTYFKAAVNKNEDKEICIKEAYQKLWDNHLKGLIHEYIRGKKSGEEIFDKIKNKYFDLTGINCKENNEDTAE